jgi:peroxiredoxin
VFGISVDSPFSLAKWAELEGYEHLILLSDLGKETARDYDTIYEDLRGMKGVAKRSLFLIDKEGTIVQREVVETPGELPDIEGAIAKMKEMA